MQSITEFDVVFLSYDEPNKEENWANLLEVCPWAVRVDGVEGIDAAHKAAATVATTERFLTVDGDTRVDARFFDIELDFTNPKFEEATLSWAGKNHTNGLIYGNGGLKLWWTENVFQMKTHEHPERKEEEKVDFCWHQKYVQMYDCFSTTRIDGSPYQSWRAGFREGVKMSLSEGERVNPDKFEELIWPVNYKRLLIWCSVGADIQNGTWAILGARMGLLYTYFKEDWDFGLISDYSWMKETFEEHGPYYEAQESMVPAQAHFERIKDLGQRIKGGLRIDLADLTGEQSRFVKAISEGQRRKGASIIED